jgi:hypothetical protein
LSGNFAIAKSGRVKTRRTAAVRRFEGLLWAPVRQGEIRPEDEPGSDFSEQPFTPLSAGSTRLVSVS